MYEHDICRSAYSSQGLLEREMSHQGLTFSPGSETTAISLSSVFSHLMGNPEAYTKLMAELDLAARDGAIAERENNRVSWTESLKLPYLDAVIQESFRMHPAPGLLLERVVPSQGMDILGEFIPGGTIVGCNAWVLHRRPEIFGQDVDTFRPERWLKAGPDRLKEMVGLNMQPLPSQSVRVREANQNCHNAEVNPIPVWSRSSYMYRQEVSFTLYLGFDIGRHMLTFDLEASLYWKSTSLYPRF